MSGTLAALALPLESRLVELVRRTERTVAEVVGSMRCDDPGYESLEQVRSTMWVLDEVLPSWLRAIARHLEFLGGDEFAELISVEDLAALNRVFEKWGVPA